MLALYKKKRAVSPVIAVILLIALTVATVAIIWQVVLPLLSTGTVSMVPVTTSATIDATTDITTWTGTITLSSAGTLTDVTVGVNSHNGADIVWTTSGEHSVTVSWDALEVLAGTYDVVFTFVAEGAEGNTIETISVTFS